MIRWSCWFLLGCASSEPPQAALADTAIVVDTAAPDTARDTTVIDTFEAAVDSATSADTAETSPPPMPVDCLAGDFGPSSYTLVDFFYQRQVGSCESSMCSDFMMFDPSCVLTLQVADVPYTATLSAAHCATFTRWLTSDLLVKHLRDTTTCSGAMIPGSFESTQLTLGDGMASKKTFMCKEEPFASHRACLDRLRAEYFPGK
jgi:hypothetical protein